jgi:hypothetical protein
LSRPEHDTDSFEVVELDASPPEYAVSERRTFGLAPTSFVAALAGACLLAAVVLFALGSAVVAILLLVAAIILAVLFIEQAHRRRGSRLDRVAAGAFDSSRGFAVLAATSVRAWSGAGREVSALRLEAKRLSRERSKVQYALGGAAAAGDTAEIERLRSRVHELDARIAACAKRAEAAVGDARERTAHERLSVSSTQIRRP